MHNGRRRENGQDRGALTCRGGGERARRGSFLAGSGGSARAKRHRFTAAYKLSVVEKADACETPGEIESSIVLGYSNKAHDGFLGHAVPGRWVNAPLLVRSRGRGRLRHRSLPRDGEPGNGAEGVRAGGGDEGALSADLPGDWVAARR